MAVEINPNKPTPPKDIAGPIPIYMISRKIKLNYKNGMRRNIELLDKFPLIIVVPDQSETKSNQMDDLNEKFKGIFNLESEYSALNDFKICLNSDFEYLLKEKVQMKNSDYLDDITHSIQIVRASFFSFS